MSLFGEVLIYVMLSYMEEEGGVTGKAGDYAESVPVLAF